MTKQNTRSTIFTYLNKYKNDPNSVDATNPFNFPKNKLRKSIQEISNLEGKPNSVQYSKAKLYLTHKDRPYLEPYLHLVKNRKLRVNFTKLRLTDHKLMIKVDRHRKIPREERICPICSTEIEDEIHFLIKCNVYE